MGGVGKGRGAHGGLLVGCPVRLWRRPGDEVNPARGGRALRSCCPAEPGTRSPTVRGVAGTPTDGGDHPVAGRPGVPGGRVVCRSGRVVGLARG
ncbi:hypothetical protein TOK_2391 [Pseudonocardia sp. N23]|nr:hypothetical protein TOK_2391 [Pseudonocardia sp. N23]